LCTFSLSVLPAHRTVHSFPTRRSSDLHGEDDRHDDVDDQRAGELRFAEIGEVERVDIDRDGNASQRTEDGPEDDAAPAARGEVEDRKSTRLNSSHVKISYAVFCLKKKK